MSEAPLEWPAKAYILHPSVRTYGDLVSNPERRKYIRADLVEAKLAKAVEALREIAAAFGCECGDAARATLGDIEGDER